MAKEFIDNFDRQLIALLQSNARESTTNLSKKLGIARTTVHERIARLERNGVIKGYCAVLNRDPFERYHRCIIMLDIAKQRQNSILERLRRLLELKLLQSVNGECDLLCWVEVPQLEDIDALLEEITAIEGIKAARLMVELATKIDRRSYSEMSQTAGEARSISRGEAG
jgi:DNA-binding Lrp family transcriptional regulator